MTERWIVTLKSGSTCVIVTRWGLGPMQACENAGFRRDQIQTIQKEA